ncbi:hypothetical protein FQR65_LT03726 [Abscondita terminalis]|nr:hypothetical protein FQR65_LT03726 [Abscondita terminalis]
MAEDMENDDQWLYGDNSDLPPQESPTEVEETNAVIPEKHVESEIPNPTDVEPQIEPPGTVDPVEDKQDKEENNDRNAEEDKQNGDGSDKEDYDEDSDDDVNVVIGDIKTSPTYASLNIKRGGLLTTTAKGDKTPQVQQPGKFSVDEFEQAGVINGIQVGEFNLDNLEDKPWRKPGADITDYFNYGFNEDTWRAYCERQKRMRVSESGTGLLPLNAIGMPRGPIPIMNDNSKYSGTPVPKVEPPKENVIQVKYLLLIYLYLKFMKPLIKVMTADRREYSRKPTGFPDMSVPPPNAFDDFHPEYDFNPEPEPFYGGYEPTQDSQWGGNSSWQPQEIKTLTPGGPALPPAPVPPVNVSVGGNMKPPAPSPLKEDIPASSRRSKSKEKESSSRREMDRPRDRDREKSHRRDRSRSRSRRHKSRSRSPNHRSHRKKKSRRHDDSD